MLQITIETNNAAFDDNCPNEVARILHTLAARLQSSGSSDRGVLIDANGNTCGIWDWVVSERAHDCCLYHACGGDLKNSCGGDTA